MFRSIVKPFILMIIFIVCIGNFSFAKNIISNISIDVVINDDGSANITQTWDGTFEEGTECYLPIDTNDFEVSNLTVKMGDKRFKNIEWDLNKSFEEKSYKCGINKTDAGVELCFGISKYGKNKYTFSYDISKLVGSYTDYDGFNFQFVNTNMDSFPTNVEWKAKLKNGKKLTYDNSRIWGFGYNGDVEISNGIANAKSSQSLVGDNYFTIMIQFNKGILKPKFSCDKSFEDVKSVALNLGNNEQQDTADVGSNTNANNNISDNIVKNEKSDLKSQIERAKLVTEYSPDTSVEDMDTVTFGAYPQSDVSGKTKDPIEWIVLERDEENKKALLFSKYNLDCQSFLYDEQKDNEWETCSLKSWLNDVFYNNAFVGTDQNIIQSTNEISCDSVGYKIIDENKCNKIFCLSIDEIKKYFGYEVEVQEGENYIHLHKNVLSKSTNYANNVGFVQGEYYIGDFWLCNPGIIPGDWSYVSDFMGEPYIGYEYYGRSFIRTRPALWVSYGSEDDKNNTGTVNVDSNKNLENAYETWDDNMFNESSYTYNHKVARISAMLCEASYNTSKLKNMILNQFGFSNIQLYNYDINDSIVLDEYSGTNCFSIAHKTTNDKTFLLVTARGTNNIEEIKGDAIKRTWWDDIVNWFSGSTYDKNEHLMLNQYKVYDNVYDFYEQVEKGVYDYLSKNPSIKNAKNMKVLITGHSLGGAAANLYGASLAYDTQPLDNKYLKHEDIFTYTFGSIKVIEDIDTNIEEGYENIFDIYNHYDSFGPNGNYAVWGASHPYQKFGHTFTYKDERVHDSEFFLSFNNHDMKNYLKALDLIDFSNENSSNNNSSNKIANSGGSTNSDENSNGKSYNFNDSLRTQIEKVKLVTEYNQDTSVEDMDTVSFGSYPQLDATGKTKDPIEWIVLERDKDNERALLLSKYILDYKSYNAEPGTGFDGGPMDLGGPVSWATCALREWLNSEFYDKAFDNKEKEHIIITCIMNRGINDQIFFSDAVYDNVFLLDIRDVEKYFGEGTKTGSYNNYKEYQYSKKIITKNSEIKDYSDYDEYTWWLRSLNSSQRESWVIRDDGTSGVYEVNCWMLGIRPAIWVSYGNQDTNEMINDDGLMNQAYETWDDNMLNQSSYSYNHNVARLSAKIAKDAYDEATLKNTIKNDLGFSNIQTYNYGSIEAKKLDYDRGNCFAISHKNVNESGENATILFIVARGTKADENPGELLGDYFKSDRKDLYFGNNENNYHPMLNCSIYDNIYDFYEQIEKGVKDYIEKFPEIKSDKNIKVLLTGHSLGGAAVNLYAAKLIDDIKHNNSINEYIKQEAVFTYTFGAITVIKNVINNYERGYENIFNIYNYYDSFGPHGNYALTYASSPYKKFGYTLIYNDDRLYFEENGMSNNNHKMENYMSALNLYNFYHEFPSKRKNYDYKINSDFVPSNVQAKIIADYNNSINSNSVSKSYYQETIKFGSYPQNDVNGKTKEPIEWIVLEKDGNKALLLSKYILDNKCFNDEWSVNKTWETSQLRSWLNDTFYRTAFSKDEQKKILSTTIINSNNIDFKTSCGNNTNDKVFLLSIDEVRKYFGSGVKEKFGYRLNDAVVTQGTKYSGIVDKNNSFGNNYYWLRSMGIDQFAASFIAPNGYLATHGHYLTYGCGVRPALWVSY